MESFNLINYFKIIRKRQFLRNTNKKKNAKGNNATKTIIFRIPKKEKLEDRNYSSKKH